MPPRDDNNRMIRTEANFDDDDDSDQYEDRVKCGGPLVGLQVLTFSGSREEKTDNMDIAFNPRVSQSESL